MPGRTGASRWRGSTTPCSCAPRRACTSTWWRSPKRPGSWRWRTRCWRPSPSSPTSSLWPGWKWSGSGASTATMPSTSCWSTTWSPSWDGWTLRAGRCCSAPRSSSCAASALAGWTSCRSWTRCSWKSSSSRRRRKCRCSWMYKRTGRQT